MLLVKLVEPPCTERYARWCERSGNLFKFPSYSIRVVQDDRKRVLDCVILSLKYGEQPISGLVNQEKVDIQDKKVDIEI